MRDFVLTIPAGTPMKAIKAQERSIKERARVRGMRALTHVSYNDRKGRWVLRAQYRKIVW